MVCLTKNKPDGTSNTVQLLLTGEIPIAALLSHQGQPTVFKGEFIAQFEVYMYSVHSYAEIKQSFQI